MPLINAAQLRAGRALADLSAAQVAELAGVASGTIWRIEHGYDTHASTLRKIVSALQRRDVIFTKSGVEQRESIAI
jgi:transcriptional regulator with XRE-family HTH domain